MAEAFGPQDPRLATSLNLARAYQAQGQYTAAVPLFQRALAIRGKALRPEHPNVATCLVHYAAFFRKTSREAEAAELDARAKVIWAKSC